MKFGCVCSGISSASVAWRDLGWRAAWFSEVDKAPSSLLAHHYPKVINIGDMRGAKDLIDLGIINAPDILIGGTPCQSFSVAGARKSLGDDRGQLVLEYVRLCNVLDDTRKRNGKPESIIVWENVPGVLNTKDNAFGCFLGALCGENDPLVSPRGKWSNAGCVFGPQRTVAWRVLDSQYFGVAQRRRRVFVVASAREGFDSCKVLFESDGVRRDIAPCRESRQDPATSTRQCVTFDRQSNCEYKSGGDIASTMSARDYKSASDLVVYGIPGNWIGRSPTNGGNATQPPFNIAPYLTKTDQHGVSYGTSVRRLTPIECERLQGYPDNYTSILSDSARYKTLGNSVTTTVLKWIGQRIKQQL